MENNNQHSNAADQKACASVFRQLIDKVSELAKQPSPWMGTAVLSIFGANLLAANAGFPAATWGLMLGAVSSAMYGFHLHTKGYCARGESEISPEIFEQGASAISTLSEITGLSEEEIKAALKSAIQIKEETSSKKSKLRDPRDNQLGL